MNLVQREEWMDRGNCRGLPPELFVPGRGQSEEPAMDVCNGHSPLTDQKPCPVRRECAEYRVRYDCMGVWGGEFFSSKDWLSQSRETERELAPVILLDDMRPRLVADVTTMMADGFRAQA